MSGLRDSNRFLNILNVACLLVGIVAICITGYRLNTKPHSYQKDKCLIQEGR